MKANLRKLVLIFTGLVLALTAFSQTREETEKWLANLPQTPGKSVIQGGEVSVDLPDSYRFINAADAKRILTDIWRNPLDPSVSGMIVPKGFSPMNWDYWVVVLHNDPSGYVSDKDASSINYDDMMKKMKEQEPEINQEREKEGFPAVHLIGWAERPYYDQAAHKLYWAKELKFDNDTANTLNYDVRILGRRGVLQLSAVGGIDQMAEVKAAMPSILRMVNYEQGSRYTDFNPQIDKVAGYGLAALIVGGVAAKAGLFKLLLAGILAGWKFIVIGCLAVASGFKRFSNWVKSLFIRKPPESQRLS